MKHCLSCNKQFENQNVRLLMCNQGCTHWFHNYPKKCLKEWIEQKSNIPGVELFYNVIEKNNLDTLDYLGLDSITRDLKCPTPNCNAEITKLYSGTWSSHEFKYHRKESWDAIDLNSDLKMRENYRLTISVYQTELIGRLIDNIWDRLTAPNSKEDDLKCTVSLRHLSQSDTNWVEQSDWTDEEKKGLIEATKFAGEFEKKIKELTQVGVYSPNKYGLPNLNYHVYLPM